jgi:hypothetical protein
MTKRWPCIVVAMLCCLLAVATSASADGVAQRSRIGPPAMAEARFIPLTGSAERESHRLRTWRKKAHWKIGPNGSCQRGHTIRSAHRMPKTL